MEGNTHPFRSFGLPDPTKLMGRMLPCTCRCMQSFKTIKNGGVDFDLLIIWIVLAACEIFESSFEVGPAY